MLNKCHSTIDNCIQTWSGGVRCHSTCGRCHLRHTLPPLYVEFSPLGAVRCLLLGQFMMWGWAWEWADEQRSPVWSWAWEWADKRGSPDWSWAQVWVWVTFAICPLWTIYSLWGVPLARISKPSSLLYMRYSEVHACIGWLWYTDIWLLNFLNHNDFTPVIVKYCSANTTKECANL